LGRGGGPAFKTLIGFGIEIIRKKNPKGKKRKLPGEGRSSGASEASAARPDEPDDTAYTIRARDDTWPAADQALQYSAADYYSGTAALPLVDTFDTYLVNKTG